MTQAQRSRLRVFASVAVILSAMTYSHLAFAGVNCWNPWTGWVYYPYASYCSGG